MNRKLISRFLTLGMMLGILTFGMNIVSANDSADLDSCLNNCIEQANICFKTKPPILQYLCNWESKACVKNCVRIYGLPS